MNRAETRYLIDVLDQHDSEAQSSMSAYQKQMGETRRALRSRLHVLMSDILGGTVAKMFEVRDATSTRFVLAVKLGPNTKQDTQILQQCGYGSNPEQQRQYVMLAPLEARIIRRRAEYDPYEWTDDKTLHAAHQYITRHFDDIESGGIIDVRLLAGKD